MRGQVSRLKDIMDALQGRADGSKKIRPWPPIIPNDKQIYRVTVEKALAPKQSKGLGHVLITRYKNNYHLANLNRQVVK